MNSEQRWQFVLRHRTAIFGYNRAEHGPAMSVVYYSATPDEIVVSTMAERAKAKAVAGSPKASAFWTSSRRRRVCRCTATR